MKISFHGAAKTVTGSCALVEANGIKFLVDCGLFQGIEFATDENLKPFGFEPKEISFVLLTHAHADHSGRLPRLFSEGFSGKVYCTPPTKELAEITFLDSAKIIAEEARTKNIKPLFTAEDIGGLLENFETKEYGRSFRPEGRIEVVMRNAGHILGSAVIEILIEEEGKKKKIVFSGDLGNSPVPLVKDTDIISGADYVVCEATYGGRIHEAPELRSLILKEAIEESIARGGTLMLPVFSLERSQEILYELNFMVEAHQLPKVKMFLDSPLAIKAVDIYRKYEDWFDEEAQKKLKKDDDLFAFRGLEYTPSPEESKKINETKPPKVILAGSGMCNGGRILYHLKKYLPDSNNFLLIVSFQAEGTLGRELMEGAQTVNINGEEVKVRAKVKAVGAYSSHADQPRLLHWLKQMQTPKPQQVFINHGEEKGQLMLQDGIKEKLGIESQIVERAVVYDI
ncbi:MAG: MBL fold metallo-hydrolase [Candidatus Paceibacterota bacterium]